MAAEEALVGHACERQAPPGDFAALLDLDHLMQTIAPESVGHGTTGIFVDDLYFAVAHEIVLVAIHQMQCGQRLSAKMFAMDTTAPWAADVGGLFLDTCEAGGRQHHAPLVDLQKVVAIRFKRARDLHGTIVESDFGLGIDRKS